MVAPYLGVLGSLQRLPYPARGYAPQVDIGANTITLLSGYKVVQRAPTMARTFQLDYNYLTDANRALLRGFALGWNGIGPFAYVDPSETNLLEPNVASTGVVRTSTRGWVAAGTGASLSRSLTGGSQGGGSMVLTATAVAGVKTLTMGIRKIPVLPVTQPITCSIYAKVASGTLGMNLNINWFNAAGAYVTTTGASVTVTTTATRFSNANATPPGGAASGQFELATSTSSAYTLTVDAPQAEYAAAATTYYPGQPGVAWVVPVGWDPSVIAVGLGTAKLTLQEVP